MPCDILYVKLLLVNLKNSKWRHWMGGKRYCPALGHCYMWPFGQGEGPSPLLTHGHFRRGFLESSHGVAFSVKTTEAMEAVAHGC